jgi:outer membrane protein assembly factor BamE (lipoprotein component of BamABCDE complex)
MSENTYFRILDELVDAGIDSDRARIAADDILDAMESGMSKEQAMETFKQEQEFATHDEAL